MELKLKKISEAIQNECPVIFTRLSDVGLCPSNALLVSDLDSLPITFIEEVVEQGLATKTYSGLIQKIDSLFRTGYSSRRNDKLLKLNAVLCKSRFRKQLVRLLSTTEALEEIMKNSYIHHNGFHKYVLLKSKHFKLRYHIFESDATVAPQENIHDHRWPFSSVCLKGELVCKVFQRSDSDGTNYNHYYYSPVSEQGTYGVEIVGTQKLIGTNPLYFRTGNIYYLPKNILHRVINRSNRRVITMVLTGIPEKEQCNLFTEQKFAQEDYPVERFTKCDIVTALTELQYL